MPLDLFSYHGTVFLMTDAALVVWICWLKIIEDLLLTQSNTYNENTKMKIIPRTKNFK